MRSSLSLFAALLLPLSLTAQPARDTLVTVSAVRNSKVLPDRASLYLIVEGTAETPADAIARVDIKLKTVSDALSKFGSRVRVEAPISYGVGPSPQPNGFPGNTAPATSLSRSVLRVQIDRLDQLGQIVAAAVSAGAGTSSSLTFEASTADSVRRSRIGETLDAARRDAEVIASALGAKLGAIVSVNSTGNFGFQQPTALYFDSRFGQQAQAPEIQMSTSVSVTFRMSRQP
ncbi:SIMPL domain-containing protein [Gemmatimonas sp.]|uniref:SIMPL domain-containing protein n=1 Tax=Gemmatimonas sp. TaxID=1962908 RepID=UPI003982DEB9